VEGGGVTVPRAVAHGRTLSGQRWSQEPEELVAFLHLLQWRQVAHWVIWGKEA